MSQDNNMNDYMIYTENEVSILLSHFNVDYILDTLDYNIENSISNILNTVPNLVSSMETYYKNLLIAYPNEQDQIKHNRQTSYNTIINTLCNKFNLSYHPDEIQDNYSITFYLYKLLVSEFRNGIVAFFTNYIYKEKNSLYDALKLDDFKKDKNSSILYNKKLYKNPKLAVINANLDYVIRNICTFDVAFTNVLNNIFIDKNIAKFVENTISDNDDFFKNIIVKTINDDSYKPIIITEIRLTLQGLCMNDMNLNDIIKEN